ncbi:MAG TPA: ion transporter [Planctomycetes bacterium]|nr:ion transporter [Planctomycetota bacterium]
MARECNAGPYQLFMLALCVFVLLMLAVDTFAEVDEDTAAIFAYADNAICIIFLIDFAVNLARAERKLKYLVTWGWIDLLSSIPMLDAARWGRAARVLRLLRLLRGVRSTKMLLGFMLNRRAEATLLTTALMGIIFATFASIAIFQFEKAAGDQGNIRTAEDAVWWSVVTMATVGYGDKYPVTTEGRLVAMAVMAAGVGLFTAMAGFLSSWFVRGKDDAQDKELDALRGELAAMRALLQKIDAHTAPPVDLHPAPPAQ